MLGLLIAGAMLQDPDWNARLDVPERWRILFVADNESEAFFDDPATVTRRAQYRTGWFYLRESADQYQTWHVRADCSTRRAAIESGYARRTADNSIVEPVGGPFGQPVEPDTYLELAFGVLCSTSGE